MVEAPGPHRVPASPTTPYAANATAPGQTHAVQAPSMGKGVGTATAVAILGAVVWGVIVFVSGYELGLLAWALGAAVGAGFVKAAGGAHKSFAAPALVLAALGIALGKVVGVTLILRDLGISTAESLRFIIENPDALFSGMDFLWFALALFTAWRISTQGLTRKPATG